MIPAVIHRFIIYTVCFVIAFSGAKRRPSTGFAAPTGLIQANICTITGQLACEGCPTKTEFFIPGTEPKAACSKDAIKKLLEEKAKKEQEERDKILQGVSTP